ncbi:MAG: hypothetical protein WKG07_19925 [Hymenobacter sp.]
MQRLLGAPTLLVTVPPQRGKSEGEQLAQLERPIEAGAGQRGCGRCCTSAPRRCMLDDEQLATEAVAPAPTKPGGAMAYSALNGFCSRKRHSAPRCCGSAG